MISKKIKQLLLDNLDVESIDIIDESHKHANHAQSHGGHFKLNIISDDFKEISLIQRHRIIYKILGEMLQSEIHALSINAKTTDEI